ncbi:MAG: hypothetical protein AMXMBFR80_13810 [Dehalococcoidia bacterium]
MGVAIPVQAAGMPAPSSVFSKARAPLPCPRPAGDEPRRELTERSRAPYTGRARPADESGRTGNWRSPIMKRFLGIFAILGALVGAVVFWRRSQDDDEFLDEELD